MSHETLLLDHEHFYREFTLRNSGFIADDDQQRLRQARILVAGCGSTGGSIIEPLVRSGAEQLILADNGRYDLNNINRQNMTVADIDRLKVEVHAERARAINPHVQLTLYPGGISPDNVHELVASADIVIDAIDVTGRAGLEMKYLLHRACHAARKAMITGYDMAATQYIPVFDYRDGQRAVLDDLITSAQVACDDPMQVCARMVPVECIPVEMYEELVRQINGKDFTSQLAIAANLFGLMATALVIELLAGRPVKQHYHVDVWDMIRVRDRAALDQNLAQGRALLGSWLSSSEGNSADPAFLERSIAHYQPPQLSGLRAHRPLNHRGGVNTYAVRAGDLDEVLNRALLRFAFVHYACVGFLNGDTAARQQLHHEPLTRLHADDLHIIVTTSDSDELLAYSTLKAPISPTHCFGEAERPRFFVEQVFGNDLYQGVDALAELPVAAIREIGRVVRSAYHADQTRLARAGLALLSAYVELVCDPARGIQAIVGDGEDKVTLANLAFVGASPIVLEPRAIQLPDDHLYAPRYAGRTVRPFWLLSSAVDQARAHAVAALLEANDAALATALAQKKASRDPAKEATV